MDQRHLDRQSKIADVIMGSFNIKDSGDVTMGLDLASILLLSVSIFFFVSNNRLDPNKYPSKCNPPATNVNS